MASMPMQLGWYVVSQRLAESVASAAQVRNDAKTLQCFTFFHDKKLPLTN